MATLTGLAVLAALLALVGLRVSMPRLQRRRAQLDALGLGAGAARALELDGRRLAAQLDDPRDRDTLLLSTPVAELPRLVVTRLHRVDRWARRWRLAPVATTGSTELDDQYLVDCDYRELAGALLRDGAVREAVDALFAAGVLELRVDRRLLRARFALARLLDSADPEAQLRHWGQALARLGNALPAFTGALTPITVAWRLRRRAVLAGCIALPLVSLGACAVLYDIYMPLDVQALARDALAPLPAAWLSGFALGVLLLRGHPSSGRLLPGLVLAVLLSAPAALTAQALLRNGDGDQARARVQVVAVTGREYRAGADLPVYRWSSTELPRRDLFGASHPITTEVPEARWHAEPIETARIRVLVAPGRLGHAWIVGTQPAAARAAMPCGAGADCIPPAQSLRNFRLSETTHDASVLRVIGSERERAMPLLLVRSKDGVLR